jgi:threonine dehydrogenase-like Zn-dependent dehydrogenase
VVQRAVVVNRGQLEFASAYSGRTPSPGHIPVRVTLAGICETDLQLVRGYMGYEGILGHEFVGIAEFGRFAGQRVVGEINCACHTCSTCQAGLPTHCPQRTVLGILNHDGAFADRVWLPEENLHPLPDSIPDDEAVFVEPLAAAWQIPAQLRVQEYRNVIVLGDGRLGNLCAQVLKACGCSVTLVGKHPWKLDIASRLGIPTALVGDIPRDRSADLVIDCTGSASGLPTAWSLVRPRGTIVLKTTVADPAGPNLAPLVIDEITVVGSRCGPFPKAIESLTKRTVDVRPLISARYPVANAVEAFQAAADGRHLKVLLEIGE